MGMRCQFTSNTDILDLILGQVWERYCNSHKMAEAKSMHVSQMFLILQVESSMALLCGILTNGSTDQGLQ